VVGIVGTAVTGIGLYLWLRSPSDPDDRRLSVVPQVGAGGVGVAALGRF
jgi:hypothetical protein